MVLDLLGVTSIDGGEFGHGDGNVELVGKKKWGRERARGRVDRVARGLEVLLFSSRAAGDAGAPWRARRRAGPAGTTRVVTTGRR